jgi:hypothetical protein
MYFSPFWAYVGGINLSIMTANTTPDATYITANYSAKIGDINKL